MSLLLALVANWPALGLALGIGALALVWPWATLGWSDVLLILAFTFVAGIVVNHASYRLGIRDTQW